ncbi:MAG: DNA polymerase Y family protein [Geminicoccaceae bacterium]|jgi:protein ImuB|nr:DNA polymerase Y family protein [Geminicoccaceae bacterium]HRY27136.1 DNA polymerase Y family protein [Geminicoccaceae bacterium]
MRRRCLSLQFVNLPIDRLRSAAARRGERLPEPLALHAPGARGQVLTAVDVAAAAAGLAPGLRLADARAILPELALAPAAPLADRRLLEGLATACLCYTPSVALDDDPGGEPDSETAALLLDITGSAHLFGGEQRLLDRIARRLDRLGLGHRLAVADGAMAAWAWARYGDGGVLRGEAAKEALARLPVQALRLGPETTTTLVRLGLRRVGQLRTLPQRALVRRFGRAPVLALERLMGVTEAPFTPLREPPRHAAGLAWVEPIGRTEDIRAAVLDLLERLGRELERAVAGARRLELLLFRVDGELARLTVRTGRPSRDTAHLLELFELQLDGLDIGFGIESLRLEVTEAAPLTARQVDLAQDQDVAELARLVDQLQARLGPAAVRRLVPAASHWPEHAQSVADPVGAEPGASDAWLAGQPRPLRLLARPASIEAMAPVPDGPPLLLRRRGRSEPVRCASGPERLEPEWWRTDNPAPRPRDYYRVTDAGGVDLWLYREGRYDEAEPPTWHLHGTFG